MKVKPRLRGVLAKNPFLLLLILFVPIPVFPFVLDAVIILYYLLLWKTTSWEITENQVICRRGIFTLQTHYMELYRINDYSETANFLERILRIKTVVILSSDKMNPCLCLFSVPRKLDIVQLLRGKVESAKTKQGVCELLNV